ncbi:MAG TPA: (2Fe-2S) ferredoxin domain-containing protein [Candidatus Thalassarchaeaceae archaeon]|nr:(2Fe-2S) ferredoxin domain-containing protein [Candidatus Thalassarchaeaceae archaeon]
MGTDSKGRTEPGFDMHVFVCGHSRTDEAARPNCCSQNSLELLSELKKRVRESGTSGIRVQKSGCLDFCENGISCVIYPMEEWYSLSGKGDLEPLLNRILQGIPAPQIKMDFDKKQ